MPQGESAYALTPAQKGLDQEPNLGEIQKNER